ncbi:hypothetical protein AB1Y20_012454 [Prymnesium parvum]|uniref:Uncharacterized protein n=1 Tax=Prymnesium parvum TaxID=97485 RepID=A0AB34ILG1_PRYPA|mmetsp:Transcript_22633/g.47994  ORF Transcript_22633/g.47994 Transcript_22633/m.47994 type:complete len:256 (-) Transcript_22633:346-1113(-)|eukprot:CAMPEP_0195572394 /NCGR_PEP_ID=MMETSP0814-20130614/4707_1 /TAXON_ID=97485 /ORGANISM="Prymnesium parvum, Strain Texoma1" /LENGTH=255 /DNA_ID=CAMNT_0040708153 /DNA_START=98 /DNA_END=865 /DNA_ORIENTATION=+
MLQQFARLTVDALMRPKVTSLVFDKLLRMQPSELLVGASQAAHTINNAIGAASCGQRELLDALVEDDLIDPILSDHIAHKLLQRRHRSGAALEELLASRKGRPLELDRKVSLLHTRLIVGTERSCFVHGEMHRFEVGSHLVVCGRNPDKLWHASGHRALLEEYGCTVQCTVLFQSEQLHRNDVDATAMRIIGARYPMFYTFEAALDGPSVFQGGSAVSQGDHHLRFRVVDINEMTQGAYFWAEAEDARPGWLEWL